MQTILRREETDEKQQKNATPVCRKMVLPSTPRGENGAATAIGTFPRSYRP